MSWRGLKLFYEGLIQLVLLSLFSLGACRASGSDGPKAEALVRSEVSIALDGRLNEPAWREAPVLKLVQQSPRPGAPSPYETEVRIIVASDRIYFGFVCKDPDPEHIAIHTMRRDETMGRDRVAVKMNHDKLKKKTARTSSLFESSLSVFMSLLLTHDSQRIATCR